MDHYHFTAIHLLEETVAANGSRTAVFFDHGSFLRYSDLDTLANRVARFMLAQGVRKGDRVAFCLEKSASAYAVLLGALKIGAPYVALDPRNPSARIQGILSQCSPSILFCQRGLTFAVNGLRQVDCPAWSEWPDFCRDQSPEAVATPADLCGSDPAYLMFTSGSTGKPKGAVMSHDNLYHFIGWCRDEYGFGPGEIHTHLNPIYFDNSVFDIYSTFFTAGVLVPFDETMVQAPLLLARRVRETKCAVWFSVPSLLMFAQVMKVATPEYFGSLKKILFGGEGYPKAKLKALWDALGETVEYHNVYGPTECTCICSTYRIISGDFDNLEGYPPLGHLIRNYRRVILEGDREVSPGDVGELCLTGPCVGLGYYAEPEQTRRAFVQNPVHRTFNETIYRTGDLVRLDPRDGKLYFAGRKDNQIKRQGYRIELEEIQDALGRVTGVDEACVVCQSRPGDGEAQIVAVAATQVDLTITDVKRILAERLPRYMMPDAIYFVRRLPKNANGKTDRQEVSRCFGEGRTA